jgi:hypothetical protein
MVLKPGQSTFVTMEFSMHGNMGGRHNFGLHLRTNDPLQPEITISVLSDWVQ